MYGFETRKKGAGLLIGIVLLLAPALAACTQEEFIASRTAVKELGRSTAPEVRPETARQDASGPQRPTETASSLFLRVLAPAEETVTESPRVLVTGVTVPGAVVSVGDFLVQVDALGNFQTTIKLQEGLNLIDVVASDVEGQERSVLVEIIYAP